MGYETGMCITSFNWPDRSHVGQKNLVYPTIVVMSFGSYYQRAESMNNVTATIAMKASSQKSDGAPPIVTLKAIFEQLAETHALPKRQVGEMMVDVVTAMTAHLQNGSRIRMSGLGTLEVKKRGARVGRNPATGETIQIMASKKVTFRPAKELKETAGLNETPIGHVRSLDHLKWSPPMVAIDRSGPWRDRLPSADGQETSGCFEIVSAWREDHNHGDTQS